MSTNRPSHPAVRFLSRHYLELLTAFAVLFVLQIGLIPFDFSDPADGEGSTEFFGTSTSRFTVPDIVSNIFLYVPIGVLLYG